MKKSELKQLIREVIDEVTPQKRTPQEREAYWKDLQDRAEKHRASKPKSNEPEFQGWQIADHLEDLMQKVKFTGNDEQTLKRAIDIVKKAGRPYPWGGDMGN